jgi:hypothetical protein
LTEDTRQTLAQLLDANEPEALVAAVGLMCERKTHDRFIGETERERWSAAARALTQATTELEHANAPPSSSSGGDSAPPAA